MVYSIAHLNIESILITEMSLLGETLNRDILYQCFIPGTLKFTGSSSISLIDINSAEKDVIIN